MTLDEAILATTPQDVHDKLSTIYDGSSEDGEIDCGVSLTDVRIGGEYYDLPQWMEEYQNRMMDDQIHTMGEAVAILKKEYGCE